MNELEIKIRANKMLLEGYFVKKSAIDYDGKEVVKTGFSDGWNNGWGNHGGPGKFEKDESMGTTHDTLTEQTHIQILKDTKFGLSKGWDKGWGNYGGPPFTEIKLDKLR
jgi:hypothetical protein